MAHVVQNNTTITTVIPEKNVYFLLHFPPSLKEFHDEVHSNRNGWSYIILKQCTTDMAHSCAILEIIHFPNVFLSLFLVSVLPKPILHMPNRSSCSLMKLQQQQHVKSIWFSLKTSDRVLCSVICEYSHTHWYYSFISLSNANSRWQCCTMISHWDGLHQMPQVSSLFPIKGYSGNTLEMSSHSCHCFWQLSISTRCPRPKHHDHTMMLCWWHNINNTLLLRNRLKYEEQYTAA